MLTWFKKSIGSNQNIKDEKSGLVGAAKQTPNTPTGTYGVAPASQLYDQSSQPQGRSGRYSTTK